MLVPVDRLDEHGIVYDVKPHQLPDNAWSNGRNVRFRDGRLMKMLGELPVFDPPEVPPYWLIHMLDNAQESVWVYGGLTKVYTVISGTHHDITHISGDYTATEALRWNGGVLGGVPVLNNGMDVPQYWLPPISGATPLVDLAAWDPTWRAQVLRPFKVFLFALSMTEDTDVYLHRVRISHPADPGGLPPSWDDTDPKTDAVSVDLTDVDSGGIVDGLALGDQFLVYKERSTHAFQFTGGALKWRNYQVFEQSGLMARNCVTTFDKGRQHFVVTGEDVLVHNIQQQQSVIDRKQQRWLLNNLSSTHFSRSFVVPNLAENEVWFCFPLEGSEWCNIALVWNRQTNTVTFRDIPQCAHAALGRVPTDPANKETWDSDNTVWDSDSTTWDQFQHALFSRRIVACSPTTPDFRHMEITQQFNGVNYESFIEREGINIFGIDRYGNVQRSTNRYKLVRAIHPKGSGGPIGISLGTQETLEAPTVWSAEQIFTPGQSLPCVYFDAPCRLYSIRFRVFNDKSMGLEGYDIDVEPLGDF